MTQTTAHDAMDEGTTMPTPSGPQALEAELQGRVGTHVKRVEQRIVAAKADALRPLGVTVPQYAALLALTHLGTASAAQLARVCLTTPQTMSTIVQNLEAKGAVRRDPSDIHRKLVEISLTESGRRLALDADVAAKGIEKKVRSTLGARGFASLADLLSQVERALSDDSGS